MKITFYIIPFLLLFMSCSKEKSSKWIVIDLKVKSIVTGEPLFCPLEIEYKMNKLGTKDSVFTLNIGRTSESGKFYGEIQVPKRAHDFKLNIYHKTFYGGKHPVSLKEKEKNTFDLALDNYYWLNYHVKNVSCFDENDIAEIILYTSDSVYTQSHSFKYCFDAFIPLYIYFPSNSTYFYDYDGFPRAIKEPSIVYEIISTKNGVTDTIRNEVTLIVGKSTNIDLFY